MNLSPSRETADEQPHQSRLTVRLCLKSVPDRQKTGCDESNRRMRRPLDRSMGLAEAWNSAPTPLGDCIWFSSGNTLHH